MTPPHELETFPTDSPLSVPLGGIEPQLRDLWRSAGADAGEGGVTRAALLNLVIVAVPERAQEVVATLGAIARELPCRALVVETTPGSTAAPGAWISALCRPASRGGKQVCCEQITLRVGPDNTASLVSTLLGLLLPDLPTVLYVPEPAALEDALLQRLGRWIDRIVVDSSRFGSPDADVRRVAAWGASDPRLEIADLAWPRLDAWRELVAAFFDAPPFDTRLAALRSAKIHHAADARAQALVTAGWLASRLGWQARDGAAGEVEWASASGPVRIRIVSETGPPCKMQPLRRLELVAADGTRFIVATDARYPTLLEARIETALACPLPRRLDHEVLGPDAEMLRLLMRGSRSAAFEAALRTAARLVTGTA